MSCPKHWYPSLRLRLIALFISDIQDLLTLAWRGGFSPEELFSRLQRFDAQVLKRVIPDPEKPFPCYYLLSGPAETIRKAAAALPPGPRILATGTTGLILQPVLKVP